MNASGIHTNKFNSRTFQTELPSWTPEPFTMVDLVQQIFIHLSSRDLCSFELVCKGHLKSSSLAWLFFQTIKGFSYDWISPPFQTTFYCVKEKRNYFLCQQLENIMNALPIKKRELKKMSEQMQPLFRKYPIFNTFLQDISALSQKKTFVKEINNKKKRLCTSAEPCHLYKKEEFILYTIFKIYNFIISDTNVREAIPEKASREISTLASAAISQGATFISRLAITLVQHYRPIAKDMIIFGGEYAEGASGKYRPFLRTLTMKAKAQEDFSGQKKLGEYIVQQYPFPDPNLHRNKYDDLILESLIFRKFYGNLSENEELCLMISLDRLKQKIAGPNLMTFGNDYVQLKYLQHLFQILVETENYEIAETLLNNKFDEKELLPKTLLLAIEVKMHFQKYGEANDFYNRILKKKRTFVKDNLSFLIGMAELKFQLNDDKNAHTHLMSYWEKREWHHSIFCCSNNLAWEMDSIHAFKNEEFQTLIEWIIAIKSKLKDEEGAEYFRNVLQLTNIDLEDTQGCLAAHQEWLKYGFYDKNLEALPQLLRDKQRAICSIAFTKAQQLSTASYYQQNPLPPHFKAS